MMGAPLTQLGAGTESGRCGAKVGVFKRKIYT
jgi:hypothetical protein